MANRYFLWSRLSEDQSRRLIRCFANELTETATAREIGLTRKTVNIYFQKIRHTIFSYDRRRFSIPIKSLPIDKQHLLNDPQSGIFDNELKNTFCVIAIMFPNGKLVTVVTRTDSEDVLLKIGRGLENSCSRKEIIDFNIVSSKFKLLRKSILSEEFFVNKDLKKIRDFRKISSKRLKSFYGIEPSKFLLHIKECQWRFNNLTLDQITDNKKPNDLYRKLLKILRDNPA